MRQTPLAEQMNVLHQMKAEKRQTRRHPTYVVGQWSSSRVSGRDYPLKNSNQMWTRTQLQGGRPDEQAVQPYVRRPIQVLTKSGNRTQRMSDIIHSPYWNDKRGKHMTLSFILSQETRRWSQGNGRTIPCEHRQPWLMSESVKLRRSEAIAKRKRAFLKASSAEGATSGKESNTAWRDQEVALRCTGGR